MLYEIPSAIEERNAQRWRLEYESAIQETDHKALFKRVEVAEAAILTRREMLTLSYEDIAERQQIELVLTRLRRLKKNVLKFF